MGMLAKSNHGSSSTLIVAERSPFQVHLKIVSYRLSYIERNLIGKNHIHIVEHFISTL